jgi:hypothetical protein
MTPQTYTPASRTSASFRPMIFRSMIFRSIIDVRHDSRRVTGCVPSRRLVALATALILASMVQGKLVAQQVSESGQYAQDQQSDANQSDNKYNQPGYAQQQPDGQDSYAPQTYPAPGQQNTEQGYGQRQPLNSQDLEQLVAPIALYPDALVAQVLTASTYPAQVADADRWRRAQGYASPDQIVAGADAQPWDPSVKALTAFPQVLAQMDQNLNWTTELGNAYYNQPQDLIEAVQVMRQRAQSAGNLRSSPQETVSYDQGNIELAPVNPQVVYVPAYNPWAVYGQPVAPYPGFSLLGALGSFLGSSFGSPFGSSAVRFGLGIAMTAFTHTPWGWLGWGLNWLAQSVLFHQSNYFSHSTTVADWGLPHGGPRAFSQRGTMASNRPDRTFGGYGRSRVGYGGSRSPGFARTREEDAYAGRRGELSHGFGTSGTGYGPTSRDPYRGFQPAVARSQENRSQPYRSPQYGSSQYGSSQYGSRQYGGSSYGSNSYRSAASYGNRVNPTFGTSMRANRTPGAGFQRSDFGKRSSSHGFKGKGFAESGRREHSGGFHFGGHAPKSSGGGKGFSHSHSGGGHSGGHGHSGSKHHH